MLPLRSAHLPGIGGRLRTVDDDFRVDEVPAYAPSGEGEHVFVHVEKRGLTTGECVGRLAQAVGIRARDVGVAGQKDRHAVTTQWLSLPYPVTPEAVLALPPQADLRVLAAIRHGNKLRTGHLRGNRFRLRVRDVTAEAAAIAETCLALLCDGPGVPNFYGEQRFGRHGDNAAQGRDLLAGRRPWARNRHGGKLDRLLISALQSELFNQWLTARMNEGLFTEVVDGDVLHKVGGGLFVSEAPTIDQPRLAAGEVVVTGPMFGHAMYAAARDALAREAAILQANGLELAGFAPGGDLATGTRRDASMRLAEAAVVDRGADWVDVCFTLPAGGYATTVMRELMKLPDAPVAPVTTNAPPLADAPAADLDADATA